MNCVKEIHRGLLTQGRGGKLSKNKMFIIFDSGEGEDKDLEIGADDILPVFIYCTANCSLAKPFTNLAYITNLLSKQSLETETKYWLTVFESALHFIATLEDIPS